MTDALDALGEDDRDRARKKRFTGWTGEPMLARLSHDHFSKEGWMFERKLDGERVIAYASPQGAVRLMSRNRKKLNDSYPEIVDAVRAASPRGCILDGEVVAFDSGGVSDFQRLQPRMQSSSARESRESGIPVYYYVFDCLYVARHDITACTLRGRKAVLRAALDWDDPVRWTPHRNQHGRRYLREACRKGWEGLIAKDAGGAYTHGRSSKWLKFKCGRRQEFVIGGFTDPEGERAGFGALLLGVYRDGGLVYAGNVGTAFDDDTLESLRARLGRLERKTSPFDSGDAQGKGVHFVTPKLVCEVGFTEWTEDGRLRHPRFKGLRRDKDPRDVHREAQ